MRIIIFLLILCSSCKTVDLVPIGKPLTNGHAHNDYDQNRPLNYALENGFTSIEVDVCSHNGEAIVSHDPKDLDGKPNIQSLYLEPLRKIVAQNKGRVFPNSNVQLILMIDLKKDKETNFQILSEVLNDYDALIQKTSTNDDGFKPIKILLSGEPPINLLLDKSNQYFFLDGRIEHLSENLPSHLIPRISASYKDFFTWNGKGSIPANELTKLRTLLNQVHEHQKKFRLWGTPDLPVLWKTFLKEGVDWINVDDYEGYRDLPKS